jgi:hypothetical protein
VSRTTYAALFTAIGTTWGVGDGSTTFNLPPDRYRVGRNAAAVAVGTLQASQNKTHTHTGSGTTGNENADHTHTQQGTVTSGNSNQSLDHTHTINGASGYVWADGPYGGGQGGGGSFGHTGFNNITAAASSTTGYNLNAHQHNVTLSGQTGGISVVHQHPFSVTTGNGSADGTDARPLSAVYLTCIKT